MTFHLVQTECPEYPPFAGEFRVEIRSNTKHSTIICPPFKQQTLNLPHSPINEVLRAYLKEQGATLVAYWPVICGQNIARLPSTLNNYPVCFIDCWFAKHLGPQLQEYFSTSKFYRCQLPAARCLVQQYVVNIFVDEQKTTADRLMRANITPNQVKELLETHWKTIPIQVEVKNTC